jgi:protein SCO1
MCGMFNRNFLIVIVVALAAGLGLLAGQRYFAGPAPVAAPELQAVRLLPQPRPLPDFDLAQADGTRLLPGELRGHWTIVFLGFTHCPDVCPLTLMHMGEAREELGDLADEALFLFITVDPERDTPEQMSKYITRAGEGVIGLTGEQETLEGIWSAYDITVELEPRDDGSYLVAHSAQIWMINPSGEVALILPPSADGDDLAHDLRWLLEQSG